MLWKKTKQKIAPDPALLRVGAEIALADPWNQFFFSPVSIIQIVNKESRGKIKVPDEFAAGQPGQDQVVLRPCRGFDGRIMAESSRGRAER